MPDDKNTIIAEEKEKNELSLLSEEDIFSSEEEEGEEEENETFSPQITLEQKKAGQIDEFRRILHIIGAFAMAGFLLVVTSFFEMGGGDIEEGKNLFRPNGESSFSFYGEASLPITESKILFGGEKIKVETGTAQIGFANGTRVKAEEGSEFFLMQMEPYPIFVLEKGEIWLLGEGKSEFLAEGVRFFPHGASAILSAENGKITASAHRHSMLMEIPVNNEYVSVILPTRKKTTFRPEQIPDTFGDLRFSKIKKEILITNQQETQQIESNISSDKRWIERSFSKEASRYQEETMGELASLINIFSLYPEKQLDNDKTDAEENMKNAFLAFILDERGSRKDKTSLSDEQLNVLLLEFPKSPTEKVSIKGFGEIIEEAEKRAVISDYLIAQSLFSLFENALDDRNIAVAESVLEKASSVWNRKKNTKENKRILDMYREVLSIDIERNMSQITGKMFVHMTKLDDLALEWEADEKDIITLEIVDRNIETIDTFLYKEEFENAKIVLEKNDILLDAKPSLYLLDKFRNAKERNAVMWGTYSVFSKKGILSDTDLQLAIKKQETQKETVSKIYDAQDFFLNSAHSDESEMSINTTPNQAEKIKNDFLEIGIRVLEIGEQTGSYVKIESAATSTGVLLSAEYHSGEKSIRKITSNKAGVEMQGEIKLQHLPSVLQTLQKEKQTDLYALHESAGETWALNKEDPLKDIDPQVVAISKRIALGEMTKKEWKSDLKNISMIAEDTLRITDIQLPDVNGVKASFTFFLNTKAISDVELLPGNISVPATHIDNLQETAKKIYDKYKEDRNDEQTIRASLERASIETTEGSIVKNGAEVEFKGMKYEKMFISGSANVKNKEYSVVVINGKSLGRNIPFTEFKDKFYAFVGKE